MHHPLVNAEIARLAHAEALRAVPAPDPADTDAAAAGDPWPVARLAAWLLPELPTGLSWTRPGPARR
jgi:hypothetical protein